MPKASAPRAKNPVPWAKLKQAAKKAQQRAYAPYSNFKVGAAILDDKGHIHVGCNVENASYGLCLCAERTAIASAVASGVKRFSALVVVAGQSVIVTPCGMCRQVLAEFATRDFPVLCLTADGTEHRSTVHGLLPYGFGKAALNG